MLGGGGYGGDIKCTYHLGECIWRQKWWSCHTPSWQVWQTSFSKYQILFYNDMQVMIVQSSTVIWGYLRCFWSRVMHFILKSCPALLAHRNSHSEIESGGLQRESRGTTTTDILVNPKKEWKATTFIGLRNFLVNWHDNVKHKATERNSKSARSFSQSHAVLSLWPNAPALRPLRSHRSISKRFIRAVRIAVYIPTSICTFNHYEFH